MIACKQEMTVTHDEPKKMEYREKLLEDGWFIKSEDTGKTTYQKVIWFKGEMNDIK